LKKLGLGVVGVGAIGVLHAENIAQRIPNAELVAVSDVNVEAANNVAARWGVKHVYSDYRQMLEDRNVEGLVISVPPFLKREMIIEAARRGKHIFVEKPMALSLHEADDIINATRGLKLQVGYQRRFDNAFVRLEKSIAQGDVGRMLLVRSWTRDPPGNPQGWSTDPKLSGGIWLDTCSHDFDAIRFLTKASVTRVYAVGANLVYEQLRPNGDFDNVLVTLELDNGALAQVDSCGYTVYGYDAGIEILGTKGAVIAKMGVNSTAEILKKGQSTQDLPQTFQEKFGQAYRDEVADFVSCVLEDREPKVTGKDGKEAIRIGLAASQSAKEKAPVYV
jgi:myo-inositol 2-dehydrogenase/D-chiro-inositol 1-dehydrogenase